MSLILHPEIVNLASQVEQLKSQLESLILTKYDLQTVICHNLSMRFNYLFGTLKYQHFEKQLLLKHLKRKKTLLQQCINSNKGRTMEEIEQQLKQEFLPFSIELENKMNQLNNTISHHNSRSMSKQKMAEFKRCFRFLII